MEAVQGEEFTLVARKPHFGLPTACPTCLPAYIYLKFARFPFQLAFNSIYPDSDQIPYIEAGTYVAYNNENGGVIDRMKQDGILDLDTELQSLPEWISMKAVVTSWLDEALMYELWIGCDGTSARKIYYSDLSWPIGKILFLKQTYILKQRLGITKENAEQREEQIYHRAKVAYGALSTRLGEQNFLFEDRPSSLDASFLSHVLFILQALPETSVLRGKLLEHSNLVRYSERLKMDFLEAGSSSSSVPQAHSVPSPSSRKGSKPKSKPKREKTEEEKTFKRRAKYFLAAQLLAVLLFLSVMGGNDFGEAEFENDDDDIAYD
ncbi:mitochondrial outer membrane import complex protein METAXIN isoform X2 [Carica papaya]|uniref:mitochondrial outer membrane import complex protein METAXIN isoform X2 n=1 Tax=Carica papaya TaxID=3649 RepID=UPI000B8C7729|nr:mitochondrial outer membrane import complex protein METAXIN isoform X2 [Carica papaya]